MVFPIGGPYEGFRVPSDSKSSIDALVENLIGFFDSPDLNPLPQISRFSDIDILPECIESAVIIPFDTFGKDLSYVRYVFAKFVGREEYLIIREPIIKEPAVYCLTRDSQGKIDEIIKHPLHPF